MATISVVNGKKTDGEIFESGTKAYLVEMSDFTGKTKLDIRLLYSKDGQLCRTPKGVDILPEDLVEFIDTLITVSGMPARLFFELEESE
jgi:hypothetical protein